MELVIDASIVFTAIAGKGVTKEIMFLDAVRLFAPEHLLEEMGEHKRWLAESAKLSRSETDELLQILERKIFFIPEKQFAKFLNKANRLIRDKDDTAYLALSLSMNKIPIWSNDDHFKKQRSVKVFTTYELVGKLKEEGLLK